MYEINKIKSILSYVHNRLPSNCVAQGCPQEFKKFRSTSTRAFLQQIQFVFQLKNYKIQNRILYLPEK